MQMLCDLRVSVVSRFGNNKNQAWPESVIGIGLIMWNTFRARHRQVKIAMTFQSLSSNPIRILARCLSDFPIKNKAGAVSSAPAV
jgi:hypothetical protein